MGLSYKDTVLADSPILFWRLDEAAGTVGTQLADASGFGLTGTIRFGATTPTGSILFNEFYGASPVSGSQFVNSTTPRMIMSSSMFGVSGSTTDISPSSSFTVEWWIKTLTFSDFNNNLGFANFNGAGAAWGWFLAHHDHNGGIYCGIHVGDRFTPNELNSGRVGATYQYVFTYDGVTQMGSFYRNGVKCAEKPMLPPASNWSTAIGSPDGVGTINNGSGFGFGDGSQGWNATYDNLSVYNKLLSADRIKQHFLSGTANTVFSNFQSMALQDNPKIYYRLSDASGSSPNIKDFSQTAGFPGSLVGGASGIMFQQPSLINGDADTGISGTTAGNAPYINVPASTGIGGSGGAFTVMWWQKVSSFPTGSAINNTIGAGFGTFFAGCSGSTGEGFMGIAAADGFTPKDLPRGFFQSNQIAHYAFTYDGTNLGYVFKNGKLVAWKQMQPATAWGANGFKIGSGSWGGEYDEVIVFDQIIPIELPYRYYTMGLGTASLPTPTIVSVQAFSGSIYSGSQILNTGGSYVLVSGSNFQPNMRAYVSGVQVQPLAGAQSTGAPSNILGSNGGWRQFHPDTFVGLSGSQFLAYMPTGSVGSASISVLNLDGQSATGSNLLLYVTGTDPYHSTVIADQPCMYWRLDDPTGSIHPPVFVNADTNHVVVYKFNEATAPFSSSGNGSIMPLVPYSFSGSTGIVSSSLNPTIFSGAVAFPGPNNGINFLTTGLTGTTLHELTSNFSAECWVYMNDYQKGNWCGFFLKNSRPTGQGWSSPFVAWDIGIHGNVGGTQNGSGLFAVFMAFGGANVEFITPFVMPLHQWVHLGFTYDGSNVRTYANGTLQTTTARSGLVDYTTHGDYTVGGNMATVPNNFNYGENLNGYVADCRISNIVRSNAYFALFAGTGTTGPINDYSNHGFTGSAYNAFPYLLFQQKGLIAPKDANTPANMGMMSFPSNSPTPFIATTGDQNGVTAPPACGIGTGSFANPIKSFSAEWWYRQVQGIGTHRFGFASGQFLYNVTTAAGNITVGTDAANQMTLNNFVDPLIDYPIATISGDSFGLGNQTRIHHYCYTFADGGAGSGTGRIYRDGVQIGSNVSQKTPLGWQAFEAIGPFSGSFDEVAVYPYALSAVQVANHFQVGYIRNDSDFAQSMYSGSQFTAFPTPGQLSDSTTGSQAPVIFQNTGSMKAQDGSGFIGDSIIFYGLSEAAPGFFPAEYLGDWFQKSLFIEAVQGAGPLDSQHNVEFLFLTASGAGTGGGGGGTPTGPVIQNFNPAVGLPIASGTVLSFDVTDQSGIIPFVALLAAFSGNPVQELVYNSVAFNAPYSNASNTVTAITGGLHFTLLRNGGWPSNVTLLPIAFSTGSENA